MKKTILFSLFLLWLVAPGFAQNLTIQGSVSNEENGEPVVAHQVFIGIEADDMNFFSDFIVLTDEEGEFFFEMPMDSLSISEGIAHVSVFDCEQMTVEEMAEFNQDNNNLEFNFEICTDSLIYNDCEAAFYWQPTMDSLEMQTNAIQFMDMSYGDIVSWEWNFGDGNESEEQNPVHVYEEAGEYEVCLEIENADGSCENIFCELVFVEDSIIWEDCEAAFYWQPTMDSLEMQTNAIQFMDMSYGDIVSWEWNFGDGNESEEQNPVHVYEEAGEYEVCLEIENADGSCENIFCELVFVDDSISWEDCEAAFYWHPAMDSLEMQTNAIQFMDMSYGEIVSWNWNFGDGAESIEQNPVHTYNEAGEYEVCLNIVNIDGTCQDVFCEYVFVDDSISWEECEAAFYWYPAMDSLEMNFNSVQFEDISYGDIVSWNWSFGDGAASNEQNPVHTYTGSGEYEVCLNIVNVDGTCEDIFCDYVFIEDSIIGNECEAYFEYHPAGDSLNQTEGYQFVDLSMGEPAAWFWDFGDGYFSEEQNPVHEFVEEGIYMVCLYIESEDMTCSSSYCLPIQVGEVETFEINGTVFAGEEYLDQGEVMLIGDENFYFDYAVIDSMGGYYFQNVPEGDYYLWAFPAFESNYAWTYAPTFYQSTLFWDEASLVIAGDEGPFDINLVTMDSIFGGICGIDGSISTSNRGSAYEKANIILTDEYDQVFQYELTELNGEFDFENLDYGTYKVHVEVVGIVSNPVTVNLNEENTQASLNYTVEGGSVLLSTKEVDQTIQSFSIGNLYPNPAIDHVNVPVRVETEQAINVSIYDVTGKMVKTIMDRVPHGSHIVRIKTQDLDQGVYQVMIQTASGNVVTKKLIK